eukprot:4916112-Prymnesium_polylepis.2
MPATTAQGMVAPAVPWPLGAHVTYLQQSESTALTVAVLSANTALGLSHSLPLEPSHNQPRTSHTHHTMTRPWAWSLYVAAVQSSRDTKSLLALSANMPTHCVLAWFNGPCPGCSAQKLHLHLRCQQAVRGAVSLAVVKGGAVA